MANLFYVNNATTVQRVASKLQRGDRLLDDFDEVGGVCVCEVWEVCV